MNQIYLDELIFSFYFTAVYFIWFTTTLFISSLFCILFLSQNKLQNSVSEKGVCVEMFFYLRIFLLSHFNNEIEVYHITIIMQLQVMEEFVSFATCEVYYCHNVMQATIKILKTDMNMCTLG